MSRYTTGALSALAAGTLCVGMPQNTLAAAASLGSPVMAMTIMPLTPPPPDALVASSYADNFHVSVTEAQRRLALQSRAGGIVAQLRNALGPAYAGVWFDNASGRFHINIAAPTNQAATTTTSAIAAAQQVASNLQISGDADTNVVSASSAAIAAAQARIDHDLSDAELKDELQTAPDVTQDVLDVHVSTAATAADATRIKAAVAMDGVPTQILAKPAAAFAIHVAACTFPNCDYLEGGVQLNNAYGTCSAGYLATANSSPYGFYMVTAGHCATASTTWYDNSRGGTQRLLGTMDRAIWNINGDYARIQITGGGVVEPDSAFWGINLEYPTYYSGWSVVGQYGCRTGEAEVQAQCGTILQNGMTISEGGVQVAGEFENSACANPGDSGGPFMMNYYAVGITTAISAACGNPGAVSFYSEVMNAVVPPNLDVTISTQGG